MSKIMRILSVIMLAFFIACTTSSAWAAVVCPTAKGSTAVASPLTVLANGIATSTITVTAKKGANTISGVTVTLTAGSGSSTITGSPAITNASGVATFTVKDAVVELVTYTAVASLTGCEASSAAHQSSLLNPWRLEPLGEACSRTCSRVRMSL